MGASGVASLLDEQHSEAVQAIWDELDREAGVPRPQPAFPHFSYHVAESYEEGPLEVAIRGLAQNSKPFRVWTSGLGVFTTPVPVLYVAVVRSLELSRYQRWVWWEVSPTARNGLDHYQPERWVPHITLAQQGLTAENLAQAIKVLAGKEFHWPIDIDTIAYVDGSQDRHELRLNLDMGGGLSD
jgi:2'-5' RNA ligase